MKDSPHNRPANYRNISTLTERAVQAFIWTESAVNRSNHIIFISQLQKIKLINPRGTIRFAYNNIFAVKNSRNLADRCCLDRFTSWQMFSATLQESAELVLTRPSAAQPMDLSVCLVSLLGQFCTLDLKFSRECVKISPQNKNCNSVSVDILFSSFSFSIDSNDFYLMIFTNL